MNQLPTTANGVLAMMANTSTEIDVFSDQVIESVRLGEVNPLKVLVQMKAMEKCTDRITKEIKENCMTASDAYPDTEFEFMGNKITKGDVYTAYDFTVCNDNEWNRLNEILIETKRQMKDREAFLKTIKQPTSLLDEGTGEVNTVHPPEKKSVPGLKVTIK